MSEPVLSIRDLVVEFETPAGDLRAADGVSYEVRRGETLGVVGESGCGKSVTVLAALGLVPWPGRVRAGEVLLEGRDLLALDRKSLRKVRGKEIAMVFQDPMTSLHPTYTVGAQVAEAVRAHKPELSGRGAWARAVELLELVGVPGAHGRAEAYPAEWSGGMRQRVMIAMAIAHRPKVLIADEPTTALDVTVQAQVLQLLADVQRETRLAIILISHDLGVIAELADAVAVMYAGRVVEQGEAGELFRHPRHPYTVGLMSSVPRLDLVGRRLPTIPGAPPHLADTPPGCPFHPRCRLRRGRRRCVAEVPPLVEAAPGHRSACHFKHELRNAGTPMSGARVGSR